MVSKDRVSAREVETSAPEVSKQLVFFANDNGFAPLLKWFEYVKKNYGEESLAKCRARVGQLRNDFSLDRPYAETVRNGIKALRVKCPDVQLRIFYFYDGEKVVILSHGCVKKTVKIPEDEIVRAERYRDAYKADPKKHTYRMGAKT